MNQWHDRDSILDIKNAVELAQVFLDGVTEETFQSDFKTQAAVIRQLEIIGEAAGRLSKGFRQNHSGIPWQKMIGSAVHQSI